MQTGCLMKKTLQNLMKVVYSLSMMMMKRSLSKKRSFKGLESDQLNLHKLIQMNEIK